MALSDLPVEFRCPTIFPRILLRIRLCAEDKRSTRSGDVARHRLVKPVSGPRRPARLLVVLRSVQKPLRHVSQIVAGHLRSPLPLDVVLPLNLFVPVLDQAFTLRVGHVERVEGNPRAYEILAAFLLVRSLAQ